MKLYGNEQSGHAYKVALALTLSQTPYDYEWVDIDQPCETRPKEFQENSRWCEVPLLLIDDQALTQSGAILQYLAREHGLFGGMKNYQQASEWVIWEANRIGMCLPQLIQSQVTPEAFNQGTLDLLQGRLDIDEARLDLALGENNFLCGEELTIADIAVFGYVYKSVQYGRLFPDNIMSWIEKITKLDYFQTPEILLASSQ